VLTPLLTLTIIILGVRSAAGAAATGWLQHAGG
jgi:hypothetical protein